MVHRSRLRKIFADFGKINIPLSGKLADFGCSNGYVISLLKEKVFNDKKWDFYGFDYWQDQLINAKAKQLKDVQLHFMNLNVINNRWSNSFDIVTCFETLEHVGNYRNALINLHSSCKVGGHIIISIPNERGIAGLLKYLGRKLLRKNAYGDFFRRQSEFKYIWYLLLNKPLGVFRKPAKEEWGPHLGFDWKLFENFLNEHFIQNGKCKILFKDSSFLDCNFIYMLEKLQ